MTLLEKCKLKLGITHSLKDDAITDDIATARLEMIRAGVSEDAANADSQLVDKAIETYIMMEYSDPSLRETFENSWEYQVNNLRKSSDYKED